MDGQDYFSIQGCFSEINSGRHPNRWEQWGEHREIVSSLINDSLKVLPNTKSIGIFGAGNCDDIDLEYITDNFEDIYLVDIDSSSVGKAIERLNSNKRNKVKSITGIDFSGLEDTGFYQDFVVALTNGIGMDKLLKKLEYAESKVINLEVFRSIASKYKFSFLISSPVYTQMVSAPLLSALNKFYRNYNDNEIRAFMKQLSRLSLAVVQNYNNALIGMTDKNGGIFVWSDIAVISMENMHLLNLMKDALINNDRSAINNALKEMECLPSGILGLKDMYLKLKKGNRRINEWIWLFDKEKSYYVRGVFGTV